MPVQGGFSEVQLARDRHTGKTVALKIVFLNKSGLTAEQVSKPIDVHCLCTCLECPSPRAQEHCCATTGKEQAAIAPAISKWSFFQRDLGCLGQLWMASSGAMGV